MDLVRLNNEPRRRLGFLLVVLAVLLGLCGRSKSQISEDPESIGCFELNSRRTCFDVYNSSLTWYDAWSRCLDKAAQLALLMTPEADALVGKYMDSLSDNFEDGFQVWIAGRELNDSVWRWTNGQPFRAQNTSTMATQFSTQVNRYENCAAVGGNQSVSTLLFLSSQCKTKRQFICQNKSVSQELNTTTSTTTCEIAGNKGTLLNDSCYAIISPDPLSWFEARYECQNLGADLAVFNESSSFERDAILSLLPNASTTLFWIGLSRNPWIWVTEYDLGAKVVVGRQEMSYAGWMSEIPFQRGRSCLAMEGRSGGTHGWTNQKCDELHPFICQQTTILTTTAPPTTASLLTTAFYDYESDNTTTSSNEQWSHQQNLVYIVVPVVIAALVIIVLGFSIYCYFSQRRVGYVQQP